MQALIKRLLVPIRKAIFLCLFIRISTRYSHGGRQKYKYNNKSNGSIHIGHGWILEYLYFENMLKFYKLSSKNKNQMLKCPIETK